MTTSALWSAKCIKAIGSVENARETLKNSPLNQILHEWTNSSAEIATDRTVHRNVDTKHKKPALCGFFVPLKLFGNVYCII